MVGTVVDAGDHRAWGFALWRERDLSRTARRLSTGEEKREVKKKGAKRREGTVKLDVPSIHTKANAKKERSWIKKERGREGEREGGRRGNNTEPEQLIEKRSTGGWRSPGGCRGGCLLS